ncbi:DNA-binding transcriptional repressor AcrR [compost metagenome]
MMHRVEFVGELEALQARHTAAMEECANKLARDMEAAAAQYGVVLRHPPKLLAKGLSSLLDGLMNSWLMGGQSFDLVQDGFAAIEMYLIGAGLPQQAVQEGFREAVACQSTP